MLRVNLSNISIYFIYRCSRGTARFLGQLKFLLEVYKKKIFVHCSYLKYINLRKDKKICPIWKEHL